MANWRKLLALWNFSQVIVNEIKVFSSLCLFKSIYLLVMSTYVMRNFIEYFVYFCLRMYVFAVEYMATKEKRKKKQK